MKLRISPWLITALIFLAVPLLVMMPARAQGGTQEAAWTTFTAAMKPPAAMMTNRPDHAALATLPTPERIDKMKAFHTQRMADMSAAMSQRGEAAKAFYAVLTPEQQKVFDVSTAKFYGQEGRKGGHMGHKGMVAPKQ